jgi:hypothetical protein
MEQGEEPEQQKGEDEMKAAKEMWRKASMEVYGQ